MQVSIGWRNHLALRLGRWPGNCRSNQPGLPWAWLMPFSIRQLKAKLSWIGMPDLQDGETTEMQGSGVKPYLLKNTGGVYSCSCPAWRNQSIAIEQRTCKHLRKLRGEAAESERCGSALP